MKKVAFILAIALIFLVGISIVLKHKISAGTTTKSPNIVLWIPIDQDGDVVFDQVRSACNAKDKLSRHKYPPYPAHKKIFFTKTINVTYVEKNPYCYWVQQAGNLIER